MKIADMFEAKNPAQKAVKIWLKISDLMVDLEDELLDIAKTNPQGKLAIQQLHDNDLVGLNQTLRNIFR